jgi:cyclohexanone monooxygenase
LRIDIRGRDGLGLRDYWADGARTHLGMMISGFPNLFMLNGPQSPGPHFSPPVLADFQSLHVGELVKLVEKAAAVAIEPRVEAQDAWVTHVNEVYARTLIPKTDSWWMGANIPGKPRQALAYGGGFPEYRRRSQAALIDLSGYVTA